MTMMKTSPPALALKGGEVSTFDVVDSGGEKLLADGHADLIVADGCYHKTGFDS